jgi:hypothetical protein
MTDIEGNGTLSASDEVRILAEEIRAKLRAEQFVQFLEDTRCSESEHSGDSNEVSCVSGVAVDSETLQPESSERLEFVKRDLSLGWPEVDMDLESYLINDAHENDTRSTCAINGKIGEYKIPVEIVSRAVATMPLSYILKSAYDHVILVDYLLSNPQYRPNGDSIPLAGCSPSEIVISLLEEWKAARK